MRVLQVASAESGLNILGSRACGLHSCGVARNIGELQWFARLIALLEVNDMDVNE